MLSMSSEPTPVMILDRLFLLVLGSSKLMAVPSYCLFESRLAGHLPRMAVTIFMAPIPDRGFSSALSSPFPWAPLLPGPSLGSPWALGLFFPWALGSGAVITKTAAGKIDTAMIAAFIRIADGIIPPNGPWALPPSWLHSCPKNP